MKMLTLDRPGLGAPAEPPQDAVLVDIQNVLLGFLGYPVRLTYGMKLGECWSRDPLIVLLLGRYPEIFTPDEQAKYFKDEASRAALTIKVFADAIVRSGKFATAREEARYIAGSNDLHLHMRHTIHG